MASIAMDFQQDAAMPRPLSASELFVLANRRNYDDSSTGSIEHRRQAAAVLRQRAVYQILKFSVTSCLIDAAGATKADAV